MIIKSLIIAFLILISIVMYSQSKMDKQAILSRWEAMDKKFNKLNNGYKHNFDSTVVLYVDSLKNIGVDTLGLYQINYVGSVTDDTCECGIIPWIAYIQWINKGITYTKKFTQCCRFKPIIIKSSNLIDYYRNSKEKINKSRIIPVIKGVSWNKKGDLLFNEIDIDHTDWYSIYCEFNGFKRFVRFQEYELECKENLFYIDNQNSILNSWRKIIDNQINEIK